MRHTTQQVMQAAAAAQWARQAVVYQAQVAGRALATRHPDGLTELATLRDLQMAHRRAQLALDRVDPPVVAVDRGPVGCALCGTWLTGEACASCSARAAPPRLSPGRPGGQDRAAGLEREPAQVDTPMVAALGA
jgi:hypothetical protein